MIKEFPSESFEVEKPKSPEDTREFSKRFSEVQRDKLAFYIKTLKKTEKESIESLKLKIRQFYEEQNEIRQNWIETQTERDVKYQSEKRKVLFLHGIPVPNDFRMSAGYRHAFEDTISEVEKALIVAFLQPAISTTTMHFENETPSHEKLPFRTGLILNGGKILNASEFDEGTFSRGFDARYSKYSSKDSSVQTDIDEKIEGDFLNYPLEAEVFAKDRNWNTSYGSPVKLTKCGEV